MRRALPLLLLVALVVPAAASAREQKIPASLVVETQTGSDSCAQCGPGGTPSTYPTCQYAVFVDVPDVKGASAYRLVLQDKDPRVNVTRDLTGPPFNDTGDGIWPVGKGKHRFGGFTGGGGSGECGPLDFSGRFEIKKSVAIFDKKLRIVGTVRHADGSAAAGIPVRAGAAGAGTTNGDGFYSIDVAKKGTYDVSAPQSYCLAGPTKCDRTAKVHLQQGTKTVDFEQRGEFKITGTIRDEFARGLGGIRVNATGDGGDTATTDAGGRFSLRLGKAGTYELSASPGGTPKGPSERFYVVKDGRPSAGQAADVTLSDATPSVDVDFELDRTLQFTIDAPGSDADAFSRSVVAITARTQRGDPAPGVQLDVDPAASGHPRAVICSAGQGSTPLWPSLMADGSVSPAGLLPSDATRTNAAGQVLLRVFAGAEAGSLAITGARDGAPTNVFASAVPLGAGSVRQLDRGELARGVSQLSPTGKTVLGSVDVALEALAERQGSDADLLSGIDAAPIVSSSGKSALMFFSRAAIPQQTAGGALVRNDTALVFVDSLGTAFGQPKLVTLREWEPGTLVAVARKDGRTFLDWPVHTTANGGLGTCLAGVGDGAVTYAAHSPVNLLRVDGKGRKLGTDGKGHDFAAAPGAAFTAGGVKYIVAPKGAGRLLVTGTGKGTVVLEGGGDVARFTARRGARATLRVSGSLPSSFRFAGRAVRVAAGMPLRVRGLPKHLRKRRLSVRVTDVFGQPAIGASLTVAGHAYPADGQGRIRVPLPKAKRLKVVVSAPGAAPLRKTLRA